MTSKSRYPGVQRSAQAARGRRLEADHRRREETASPATLSDNELWAAIYRMHTRNYRGNLDARITELQTEQARRRNATS